MLSDSCIEGFAKPYRWVHVLTVAIIDEAARLANKAVDYMSIVEPNLVFPNQTSHLEKLASWLPDLDMIGMNARLQLKADQIAWNGIRVLLETYDAGRRNLKFNLCERWEQRWW